jgi:hypothetical protein
MAKRNKARIHSDLISILPLSQSISITTQLLLAVFIHSQAHSSQKLLNAVSLAREEYLQRLTLPPFQAVVSPARLKNTPNSFIFNKDNKSLQSGLFPFFS